MTVQFLRQPEARYHFPAANHVRKHPIFDFILLTFALSWLVWGIYAYFPSEHDIVWTWVFRLGGFGPAAAAMLLARVLNPTPSRVRPVIWWSVFIVAALFGWGYFSWKGDIKYTSSYPAVAYILAAGVVIVWGLMIAGIVGRSEGVRNLMRRQIKWSGWWLVVLAISAPLVIEFLGIGLTNLTGGKVYPWLITGSWQTILPLIISVVLGVWMAGGGQEEAGWRGFMQPYLQQKYSPLITGIIIGVVMGLWHFPLHFLGFYAGNDLYAGFMGLAYRIITNVVLGIVFTWFYNRSRGSLLTVMLFHTAINSSSIFIASTTLTQVLMIGVSLAVIPIDRMWRKLPPEEVQKLL